MLERKIHWHQNISAVLLTSSSSTAVQTLLSLVATPTFKCLQWSCLLVPVLSATSMSIAPCRCRVLQSLGRAVQSYRCFTLPHVQELGWDEAQHARSVLLAARGTGSAAQLLCQDVSCAAFTLTPPGSAPWQTVSSRQWLGHVTFHTLQLEMSGGVRYGDISWGRKWTKGSSGQSRFISLCGQPDILQWTFITHSSITWTE